MQTQQGNKKLAKISKYIKQKSYVPILGTTKKDNIVYATEGTDVTDDVLKGLNEQYDNQGSDVAHIVYANLSVVLYPMALAVIG